MFLLNPCAGDPVPAPQADALHLELLEAVAAGLLLPHPAARRHGLRRLRQLLQRRPRVRRGPPRAAARARPVAVGRAELQVPHGHPRLQPGREHTQAGMLLN